jgi:hypothetical protein
MKWLIATFAAFVGTASPGVSANVNVAGTPAKFVITALSAQGTSQPAVLEPGDLKVSVDKAPAQVTQTQRLTDNLADLQLFILMDDSTRSTGLGVHLSELKAFVESLPPSTQVAIGYMRNGTAGMVQPFTTDHEKAAASVRLPLSLPGINASPYFALSDLAKHWPSKETSDRRVVLMLTDGVDRYYGNWEVDDPYVDEAIHDSLKNGLLVYSIYIRDAGLYDRGNQTTLFAQSRLDQVTGETGGHAYFQEFTDPVSITPFLKNLRTRLDNQYLISIEAPRTGVQPLKVQTEVPGVKIEAPKHIDVR